jgi:hypothetical protein
LVKELNILFQLQNPNKKKVKLDYLCNMCETDRKAERQKDRKTERQKERKDRESRKTEKIEKTER